MNPYQNFVGEVSRLMMQARLFPLGDFPAPTHAPPPAGAPGALIFSPHPDDEVIIGALALRLVRQSRWRVANVAVTQGSNKDRQPERLKELSACCGWIGFDLIQTRENGLEGINTKQRSTNPGAWREGVRIVADLIAKHQPRVLFLPHERDWNSTHIGTHHLVADALGTLGKAFSCYTVETEFWGAMDDPNLMVESSDEDLAELITALSFHVGEVQRNPYHLRLPAWMIDNVRRGGELVGGQGGAAPDFTYATLYRVRRWQAGQFTPALERGVFLPRAEDPAGLFK